MVTDNQVRILMKQINQSKKLKTAAAKAGMSEKTARKYRRSGKLPSQCKPIHDWKTHEEEMTRKFTLKSRTAAGEIDFAADLNEEQLAVAIYRTVLFEAMIFALVVVGRLVCSALPLLCNRGRGFISGARFEHTTLCRGLRGRQ